VIAADHGNVHSPETSFHHGQTGDDPVDRFERCRDNVEIVRFQELRVQPARHHVTNAVDDNAGIVAGVVLARKIDRLVEQARSSWEVLAIQSVAFMAAVAAVYAIGP
jgi:hypothetical protein